MSKNSNYKGINSSQLIRKVSQIPALWDKRHKNYRNKDVAMEYWSQLAHEMKRPVEDVQLRWKSIRDRHRKERKRLQGDQKTNESGYHFYNECAFLNVLYDGPTNSNDTSDDSSNENFVNTDSLEDNNHVNNYDDLDDSENDMKIIELFEEFENPANIPEKVKTVKENDLELKSINSENNIYKNDSATKENNKKLRHCRALSRRIQDDDDREIARLLKLIESENNGDVKMENNVSSTSSSEHLDSRAARKPAISSSSCSYSSKSNNKNKRPANKNVNSNCRESVQSSNIPKNDEDEDKAFFISLLPHLQKLSSKQKLHCRMEIQRLIYKFAYDDNT